MEIGCTISLALIATYVIKLIGEITMTSKITLIASFASCGMAFGVEGGPSPMLQVAMDGYIWLPCQWAR